MLCIKYYFYFINGDCNVAIFDDYTKIGFTAGITVKYTSENAHNNIKLDKTRKIVENTLNESELKFGELKK